MEYKTLYRRFRPQIFDDVIGQDGTIETLINQINSGNITHAYLFTGSRGTGKTSTSKIFSRAVNCESPNGANPCNVCSTCQSILSDANMDVFEMDAASNNGVDDIRELKEIVKFPPSSCKYKVMIIDEVHMLSKGAFNALLKTLEEPPAYMIFILATTEPHKVPATITSRCQRFEFKRIDKNLMVEDLSEKCDMLNVNVEKSVLKLIVRLSEGAMRDAQSLLEQCLSYTGDILTYDEASKILGRTQDDALNLLAEHILNKDDHAILKDLRTHYQNGRDVNVILSDLIALFRAGMLYSVTGDIEFCELSQGDIDWIHSLKKTLTTSDWLNILDLLLSTDQRVRYTTQPWIIMELSLLQHSTHSVDEEIENIHQRLTLLEGQNNDKRLLSSQNSNMRVEPERERVNVVAKHHTTVLPKDEAVSSLNSQIKTENSQIETDTRHVDNESEVDIKLIKEKWDVFLNCIKSKLVTTYALMNEVEPVSFDGRILTLRINEAVRILKNALENKDNNHNIVSAFKEVFGLEIIVKIVDDDTVSDEAEQVKDFFKNIVDEDKIIIK